MRTGLRLALLALTGALVLLLVACGDDDKDTGASTNDPRALLERAFAKPVDSGEVRARIGVGLEGMEGLDGPIALTVRGPFESRGEDRLPNADLDLGVKAGGLAFDAGLKLTDDKLYLEFQGDSYEVGDLPGGVEGASGKDGKGGGLAGLDLDPSSWLEDPELEDGREIGGDATRRITGSVDVEKAVEDLLSVLDSPEVKRELESEGDRLPALPELDDEDRDKLREAIKDVRFEANVDGDDVLRRVLVKGSFDVPSDAGIGGLEGGDISVDYVLEKVGGEIDVQPPRNPQPLGELLRKFGLTDPFGLTERQ